MSELPQGHHACLVYTQPAEAIRAVAPFLRAGLEAGERCVYVLGEHSREAVLAALTEAGVAVGPAQAKAALVLVDEWEVSFPGGEFDPSAMIGYVQESIRAATAAGFSGLRVAAEMTWALQLGVGHNRLIHYEALGNHLYPHEPLVAVCMYDRGRFPVEVCQDAVRVHPVVGTGETLQSNLFYELPEHVLGPQPAAERLEWMLEQLERLRSAHQEHAAKVRAQTAAAAKDELLATLAHELKGPLAAASTVAQLTLRKLRQGRPARPEELQRALERVVQHIARQTRIIDDVLVVARSTREELPLDPSPLDLAALVRDEVDTRRVLAPERELQVQAPPHAPARADGHRLGQLLANLLDNALKFSPASTPVAVQLQALADGYELIVSDRGPGIAEELRERVFECYHRSDGAAGGLGLGLHICRTIAVGHGGRIYAEPNPGGGTRMVVRLPRATAALPVGAQ